MSRFQSSRGAQLVTLEQLSQIDVPAPAQRWRPVGHSTTLGVVETALAAGGYDVARRELYVFRSDEARFLALLDLSRDVSDCSSLVVGLTSSNDQSLPFSFFAGHRCRATGCVTFRTQLSTNRKHTTRGLDRFTAEVHAEVAKIPEHLRRERERIERMKRTAIDSHVADSLILRAFESRLIPTRSLTRVIREWRSPRHEAFAEPTYWSFENILAAILACSVAQDIYRRHIKATMQLGALIDSDPALMASVASESS